MGDAESGPVRLSFNPLLRVEFRGATVTSDAGLLLPREPDERLGLSALIERHLTDPRTGRNRQCPLPDLFRHSVYTRMWKMPGRPSGAGSDVALNVCAVLVDRRHDGARHPLGVVAPHNPDTAV
jgi:hypothetical protein